MEDLGGMEGRLLSEGLRGMEGGPSLLAELCLSIVLPLGSGVGCWGRGGSLESAPSVTSRDCVRVFNTGKTKSPPLTGEIIFSLILLRHSSGHKCHQYGVHK